jgi:uncharacterized protein
MMKIQIGGLSEGEHPFQFEASSSEVGLTEGSFGEVTVKGVIEKTGSQFALSADVTTTGRFSCDRCTAEFQLPLSTSYRMYYVTATEEGADVDPDELQILPQGTGSIDIADDVRQTILLVVPLKLLCTESCKGLCPSCGTNLNTGTCSCDVQSSDPRWEALRALRDEM